MRRQQQEARLGRAERAGVRYRVYTALLFAAAAALLLGTADCGAAAPPPEAERDRPAGEVIPFTDLGPEDEIDAVELVVDAGGKLHAAWREVDRRPDGTGLPEYRTLYLRSGPEGDGWTTPERLPFRAPPRLVLVEGRPHAVAGRRLEMARRENDGSWRPVGRLLPESLPDAVAFDAAVTDGNLLVAALTRRGADGPLGMGTFGAAGGPPQRRLAEYRGSPFDQPEPRLLADGERLDLVWAVNGSLPAEYGKAVRVVGRVFHAGSGDGGATWSPPVELTATAAERPSTVEGLELVRDGSDLLALYASFGLHASRSADGESWSRPVLVSGISGSSLEGGTGVRSPTSAGGAVAWIDPRYRESDRRWWKPLGGFPWSDSPDWADDDLLLLTLDQVRAALDRDRGSGELEPRRVTLDLTHVHRLRSAASADNLYLLWSGRHPVGKTRSSRGAAPALHLIRLRWP